MGISGGVAWVAMKYLVGMWIFLEHVLAVLVLLLARQVPKQWF